MLEYLQILYTYDTTQYFSFVSNGGTGNLTALKGCRGIVFTNGVRMGGRTAGNSLSGLYLRNRKV